MQQCIKIFIIPYLYEGQHVSGNTTPIIRSLKLHWQPLIFQTWKVVGHRHRTATTRPTTLHVCKTRGCQCSFRLLMMGGVSPETCWSSYKYGIIKILIHSCILLDFSSWTLHNVWHSVTYTVCSHKKNTITLQNTRLKRETIFGRTF
jgi:hypothetical protein